MAKNNSDNYQTTQYNVLTGGATNALNNVAPSSTSGVPLISQGSSSQPTFGTAVVAGGGTGLTTDTAYAVLCGGTTSTGALQSIAGVGTSGQALTSNGASNLPTFQTFSPGGSTYVFISGCTSAALSASSTYFFFIDDTITTNTASGAAKTRIYIPNSCTLTKVYGVASVTSTNTTNNTLSIRKNNSSDTTVSSTLQLNAATVTFNNTGLSLSLSAGDYIEVKFVTGAWHGGGPSASMALTIYLTD